MATIVWDAAAPQVHRPRRRPARCTSPVEARAAARCRARNRRVAGVGVGVAVAGALALGLVPGGDGSTPSGAEAPLRPVAATSPAPGAGTEAGGTYEVIDRALAGTGDVTRLVAGLEGASGE